MAHFKYLNSQFTSAFLNNGVIRIGSLYDFRCSEKYNKAISDEGEGSATIYATNENLQGHTYGNTIPGVTITGGADISMGTGASVSAGVASKDLYIFCVSTTLDVQIAKSFQVDACIEIQDINEFAKLITEAFPQPVDFLGVSPCYYVGREIHHKVQPRPQFHLLKDDSYKYQEEVRLAWLPKTATTPKPFIQSFPKLKGLIKQRKF